MKPPIIVYEPGDVGIFRSVEDAERKLEPADVIENLYTVYDSEGRLLQLAAPGAEKSIFLGITSYSGGKVVITSAESEPAHVEDLRRILREILTRVGGEDPNLLSTAPLARIIHERFCCNRGFAAPTNLHAASPHGGRQARRSVGQHTVSSMPPFLAAPRACLAWRLRDFATNRHE